MLYKFFKFGEISVYLGSQLNIGCFKTTKYFTTLLVAIR
jgi:hypothetical protein